jgi:hypothetical protein
MPVTAAECDHEGRRVGAVAQAQRRDLQPGRPPLRPLGQCGSDLGVQRQPHRLAQEALGLVRGEGQVGGAQLDQLSPRA